MGDGWFGLGEGECDLSIDIFFKNLSKKIHVAFALKRSKNTSKVYSHYLYLLSNSQLI